MVLPDANNPTVKPNFHDSEREKDDPFVILGVELAMYSRTATRDIHARRIKILISSNRTSSDVSRLIIIFQDLGINHSDVMDWLPWIQEFLIQSLLSRKLFHTATWHH